jgi:hypothetical protein
MFSRCRRWRWTHYYAEGKDYRQLDFLWAGRAL